MEVQGIVNRLYTATADTTSGTIAVQVVGSASAWTAPSDKELQAILNDVYDEATGALRVVEVT